MSEIVVDLIACYAEIKQNIRVSGVFGSIMSSWTYFHMLGALMTGCLFSLLILTHVPNLLFCEDALFVCSCSVDEIYPEYAQFCMNATNGTNSSIFLDANATHLAHNSLLDDVDSTLGTAFIISMGAVACIAAVTMSALAWIKTRENEKDSHLPIDESCQPRSASLMNMPRECQ